MTPLWLTRARLRQDASLAALAPVLMPEEASTRIGISHRLVWTLFGDHPDRRRDFLWREDKPGQFMLLSARPPEGVLFDLETKPFAPQLEPGDCLRFMLRVNPTVTHAVPGRAHRGKPSDVVMDALKPLPQKERAEARPGLIQTAGAAWLRGRAEPLGFAVRAVQADGYEQVEIPRDATNSRKKPPPIRFSVLDLEGELEVKDPAVFLSAITSGFGRARAFGCGLMLIRRAA